MANIKGSWCGTEGAGKEWNQRRRTTTRPGGGDFVGLDAVGARRVREKASADVGIHTPVSGTLTRDANVSTDEIARSREETGENSTLDGEMPRAVALPITETRLVCMRNHLGQQDSAKIAQNLLQQVRSD